jgi:non-ribosomal peptide synthetase component F
VRRLGFSGVASSIFTALLNGATLCTYPLDAATLPSLAAWIRREQVTIFHAVPAIFRVLVASGLRFPDVRVVRLEGDRASWRDVELFRSRFSPTAILANGLGTTETGLVCQYRVGPETALEDGVLPVGLPAPGMEVLVLDEHGAPKPDGSAGEIAVRSRYLAAGYMGAPELTAERFLQDGGGDARIYRTGDVGRVGPGGRLEYLGRIDGSLRIGGVRVEPAEVEDPGRRSPTSAATHSRRPRSWHASRRRRVDRMRRAF